MKWRGRLKRWLIIYAVLLLLSLLSQWLIWPGWPASPEASARQHVRIERTTGEAVTLAYRVYDESPRADKPTLIALHGSPTGSNDFAHLGPMLAKQARVIAIDMPGYGQSSKWVKDYSAKAYASDTLAFMDALNIPRADVLGFSYGSGVALRMVEQQPERIRSLIFYGGIGIQEGEGSGDYHFEHLKYGIGYGVLVAGIELVPHFGLLGRRDWRHAMIRNFWDLDQRPMRRIIENLEQPLLILHGRDDPLVAALTAYEHHDLVAHSELVMFDASHFMVFSEDAAQLLAYEIAPFLARADEAPKRRTLDHTADRPLVEPTLPGGFNLRREMGPWSTMGAIIVGTFILEDPTSVGVGLLIKEGHIDLFVGLIAVFVGIFVGDLGLYAIGYFVGRPALKWKPVADRLPVHRFESLGKWFDHHGYSAVIASRFIPGSRLPLYVAAGALGNNPGRFALWTFSAVGVWVVVMLAIVIVLGEAAVSPFKLIFGQGWLSLLAAMALLLTLLHNFPMLFTRQGRQRLIARWSRLWRWEFWPMWIFYAPLVPYLLWLSLRYGVRSLTAVNPAIPHSGFIGESKYLILRLLPEDCVLDAALIDPAPVAKRMAALQAVMQRQGWAMPMILKPNEGQRGESVRCINNLDEARVYLETQTMPVLAQVYHAGPREAGVFYVRKPGEARGRIFSITDKHFSTITGDGQQTLEQLIWAHKRYRMQANVFLTRHEEHRDRVLNNGEVFTLAKAGNHCQGTMFCDGGHLITPALEASIDAIAQHIDGFYFGRFDLRYEDVQALKNGEGYKVIELNGVTSESTNIYDPGFTLWRAYRILAEQWRLAFEIGSMNRKAGANTLSLRELLRMARAFRKLRVSGITTD